MKKQIIIFSSKKEQPKAVLDIFDSLAIDYSLELRGVTGGFFSFFNDRKWSTKRKWFYKDLFLAGRWRMFFFGVLRPFLSLFFLIELFFLKRKQKDATIILLGINEKIILSPLLKFLKLTFFYLETEDLEYREMNKKLLKKFIKTSRQSRIICLNEIFKYKIENLGISSDNFFVINPGIEIRNNKYQDNIFTKIAKNENGQLGKKFFTIGTITDLDDQEKIEILFSAFKNSMEIVPRLQLILVGDGKYCPDKNPWAKWLAKKMGIDTMVWFITDTKSIKKWLDSFDIFVLSSRILKLDDYKNCLYAMESGLAPLVPLEIGFDDLIIDGKNGYKYNINNSETLTDLIIKYYKDKNLKISLGLKAKNDVEKNFQASYMREQFKKIL